MWSSAVQFELGELLGEGSQGRVFKALRRDRKTGLTQTIAVKILHSRNAVEVWKREFESLSRVRSPYCVQVLSFERLHHRPALILEYVDGVSLMDLARTPATALNFGEIEEIAAQIGMGLRDLSAQQVFHGDLSPHNVLVDQRGQIRLLDFGLANFGGSEIRLTPAFAAPARLGGLPASLETDLISLGKLVGFLKGRDPRSDQPEIYRPLGQSLSIRRRDLGNRVRACLEYQRSLRDQHTRIVRSETDRPRLAFRLTMLFILLMVTASPGAQRMFFPEHGTLRIRTRLWHHLSLDGHPIGYAPMDISIPDRSTHHLNWQSPVGRGSIDFRLKPGELRLMTDRDLTH
jgi:serine/threonine protein kinase